MKNPPETPTLLVTGAARRIGKTLACYFHERGYRVLIHYQRSEKEAAALCKNLNAIRASSADLIRADLSQKADREALVQQVLQERRLDVLIHNASQFFKTPVGSFSEESWHQLIDTNLKAPYYLSLALAPLLEKSQGNIIALTDFHVRSPLKGYPIYSISKAGLDMMVKTLARELGPSIRINAIAPGNTLWPEGASTLSETEKRQCVERTALKTSVDPQEIAQAAWYLSQAKHVTGQCLGVDAGRL